MNGTDLEALPIYTVKLDKEQFDLSDTNNENKIGFEMTDDGHIEVTYVPDEISKKYPALFEGLILIKVDENMSDEVTLSFTLSNMIEFKDEAELETWLNKPVRQTKGQTASQPPPYVTNYK